MIRSHWRDPHFWTWWWRQRVPGEAKIVAAVVAVSLLGFGGYAAAGGLTRRSRRGRASRSPRR